jgi:Zn-dependent protease with chaperone function
VNAFGHVLFNMCANSVISFLLTLGVVYGALRLGRFEPGRCRLWLLLLPFAKVVLDLATGVPESSFLWAKLAGQTQDLGAFRFGFGLSQYGPNLTFELGAFSGGLIYPQSLGDVMDAGLSKRIAPWFPPALAVAVSIVGLARLAFRWSRAHAFMRNLRVGARVVDRTRAGRREVDVLVTDDYAGAPFAAGVLRPCIVFSRSAYAAFTDAERDAALHHELAHIAHHDLVLLAGLNLVADVFWFLPGGRGLFARIHGVLEQRADDSALAAGAQPAALASALVRAGEILRGPVPGIAILSNRSLLERRVRRLLQSASDARRSRPVVELARIAFVVFVTIMIAQALFLGNHAAALVRFPIP